MSVLGVIPARYASTRFPGKPLVEIAGKSMLQRVYEQVSKATKIDKVVVATDDKRIFDHVKFFGGEVLMTLASHQSGTDRCAEVANLYEAFQYVVNIQGDEPFIDPSQINQLAERLLKKADTEIATLAKRIDKVADLFDPNVVKVVFDKHQKALYFSRSTIPFLRQAPEDNWLKVGKFYKHIGLYGFKREVLLNISNLEQSHYEKLEALEQLRWLEEGYNIAIEITEIETLGIDSPEDLKKIDLR